MKIRNLRWWIAGLLFLASILNYIDRQTLSILAPTIQKELKMDDNAYATVLNFFLVAYTLSYLFSGRLADKWGTRRGMGTFVTWWSISNMLTAFASSAGALGAFRFSLGLGEAGNYTAAPKAVSEWFPAKERGTAIGVYTLGATIGATVAPIFVTVIAARYGWREAFVITGALGLLWVGPWLWLYRKPAQHPFITEEERSLLTSEEPDQSEESGEIWGWGKLLQTREVWVLMLGRLMTDPVWYFYQFWFAKYLFTERKVPQEALAITWVVFLAADIGSLAGGRFSGQFIRRGRAPVTGRLLTMLGCAALIPCSLFVPLVGSLNLVLVLGMVMVFAHMSWLTNLSALVVDLVPRRTLASVFGLVAAGSSLGGLLMNKVVSALVTDYSYGHWFVIMAFLHPVAWIILWFGIGRKPTTVPAGVTGPAAATAS